MMRRMTYLHTYLDSVLDGGGGGGCMMTMNQCIECIFVSMYVYDERGEETKQ